MAALRCIAAARIGFRLAALHSVAERVNPRKARPPTPHGPRVLASVGCPHSPLLGEERTAPGLSKNQDTESCDLFHPRGHTAMARQSGAELRIVAAEACGAVFGQTGTDRVGWYACPWRTLFATEWSAARRKRPTAAALHLGATISADIKAVRFRRAAAENFRPEIFEARATLRSQRESAMGRRSAPTLTRPRLPGDRTARLRHPNPQVRPCLLAIEECPH